MAAENISLPAIVGINRNLKYIQIEKLFSIVIVFTILLFYCVLKNKCIRDLSTNLKKPKIQQPCP